MCGVATRCPAIHRSGRFASTSSAVPEVAAKWLACSIGMDVACGSSEYWLMAAICPGSAIRINTASTQGLSETMRCGLAAAATDRSEEHTSELQSVMRNSYAVFGLTKQTISH